MSEVWYAREEIEESYYTEPTTVKEASYAKRYLDAEEFEIALHMAQKGFEDTSAVLSRYSHTQLHHGLTYMAKRDWVDRRVLDSVLSLEELKAFSGLTGVEYAHAAVVSIASRIQEATQDDALKEKMERTILAITRGAVEIGAWGPEGKEKLFAAKLMPALLAVDPGNTDYKKLHKRLKRHFKWAELTNLPMISTNSYSHAQIAEALHSLGELSQDDIISIIADQAIKNGKI